VLENGEFLKVGSSKVQKTDVRVVAATNVNLLQKVQEGKFREDLYYRLSTVPIYVPPLRERGKDIELLFRKFATDFAEKYRVKPISLTEDAKQILLRYRFPGNIRQLKNLAEQISVLSAENKEISAEVLSNFIPKDPTLPALYNQNNPSDISEREILYKVLFDLKKDVTELKKIVMENPAHAERFTSLNSDHNNQFESLKPERPEAPPVVLNLKPSAPEDESEDVEDISHETEDDSLSIEKKEKELIIRALAKNRNKRKYAARDLGISERTLYRKIKEYGLEE
jgi:DNA-binding NtrC family response regulator